MPTDAADHDSIADSTLDALATELGAMQVIGQALGSIRDRETRLRVLAWAHERFNAAPAAAPRPVRSATPAADEDPTLSVDSLYELFEPRSATDVLSPDAPPEWASAYIAPSLELPTARKERAVGRLMRRMASSLEFLATDWMTT